MNPPTPNTALNRIHGAGGEPIMSESPLAFQNPEDLLTTLAPAAEQVANLVSLLDGLNVDGGAPDSVQLPAAIDGGTP